MRTMLDGTTVTAMDPVTEIECCAAEGRRRAGLLLGDIESIHCETARRDRACVESFAAQARRDSAAPGDGIQLQEQPSVKNVAAEPA